MYYIYMYDLKSHVTMIQKHVVIQHHPHSSNSSFSIIRPSGWVTVFTRTVFSDEWLFVHGVKGSSNNEPANFTGTCSDFVQLCITQEPPHGVVVDVAVPTCWQVAHKLKLVCRNGAGCFNTAEIKCTLNESLSSLTSLLHGLITQCVFYTSSIINKSYFIIYTCILLLSKKNLSDFILH